MAYPKKILPALTQSAVSASWRAIDEPNRYDIQKLKDRIGWLKGGIEQLDNASGLKRLRAEWKKTCNTETIPVAQRKKTSIESTKGFIARYEKDLAEIKALSEEEKSQLFDTSYTHHGVLMTPDRDKDFERKVFSELISDLVNKLERMRETLKSMRSKGHFKRHAPRTFKQWLKDNGIQPLKKLKEELAEKEKGLAFLLRRQLVTKSFRRNLSIITKRNRKEADA